MRSAPVSSNNSGGSNVLVHSSPVRLLACAGRLSPALLCGARACGARCARVLAAAARQQTPPLFLKRRRTVAAAAAEPAAAAAAAAASPKAEEEASGELGLYAVDPDLRAYADHLEYRWKAYLQARAEIVATAGSLQEFARGGYQRYGIVRDAAAGKTVYREWAPAAQAAALIGDFSNWEPVWMARGEFGVWSVELPDGPDGAPAIPHGSRVKVRLQAPGGWWADRVPAWARRAAPPPNEMGARFDGIHWDAPPAEQYVWRHERPPRPASLRIYEAHVGMSGEEPRVHTYAEFAEQVLPRVKAQGYTAIQLMAVQEHAYYGSFGYHVTSPFAPASRSGTPEELKALVDAAHGLGLVVLLDVVHSHFSKNEGDGIAGFDLGQDARDSYLRAGADGYHSLWDSRVPNYGGYETKRLLLANLAWWIDEFRFDGFRFDGVTSMLYRHHGIGVGFSGGYHEYFGPQADVEACVYLMLANELVHTLLPAAVTIAEDVSGMPGLCRPVKEGGLGFDYRLGMALPDEWIRLLKHVRDEHWPMAGLVSALTNRRYTERTVGYAESHDQALVGDKTIAMWLFGPEIYDGMSALSEPSPVVARGMALHKMIRCISMALGGEAWLSFMGNEFGHPEWIDFPREGNNWSHQHCRRQWSLADASHLRYAQLGAWDRALNALDDAAPFLADPWQWATVADEDGKVIVAERGPLVLVFNFHPSESYEGLQVPVPEPGRWRVALDSDAFEFGGRGRGGHGVDHFTEPAPEGQPFHGRGQSMRVLAPARTVVAYRREKEPGEPGYAVPAAADEAPAAADEAGSSSGGSGSSSGTVLEEQGGGGGGGARGGGGVLESQDWFISERDDGTDGRDGTALA